jgi:hypothetical protein
MTTQLERMLGGAEELSLRQKRMLRSVIWYKFFSLRSLGADIYLRLWERLLIRCTVD